MTTDSDTMFTAAETEAMDLALAAALRGHRGANPLVGAAILGEDGRVLHVGHHRGAGTPHAEVDAIDQALDAGTDLTRCTMVVTLEPCNHTGRTGPCAEAVVEAGIPRLVHAVADPTENASGGAARLHAAGIQVHSGLRGERAEQLNHRWTRAQGESRPFVTVKTAQTLDARIAAADGTSTWITNEESRAHAHGVRARVDAIVVGTTTVLTDDPRLTVRTPAGDQARGDQNTSSPLRVVMGHRDVPTAARVRGADGRFRHLRTHDPAVLLTELYEEGVRHVLVEGGATVVGAFLAADLADEVLVYQAPLILGAGRPSYPDLGIQTLSEALKFLPDESDGGSLRRLGSDVLWHLQPVPEARTPMT